MMDQFLIYIQHIQDPNPQDIKNANTLFRKHSTEKYSQHILCWIKQMRGHLRKACEHTYLHWKYEKRKVSFKSVDSDLYCRMSPRYA